MIAAHADWSVDPAKRWVTIGRKSRGTWVLDAPVPVGHVPNLLPRLAADARGEPVILGIDCPIGLPRAYAAQLPLLPDFPTFLKSLHPSAPFFQVATRIEEVSLARPFFPAGNIAGPGFKRALAQALGLPNTASLSRQVDRRTANRPAGGQLFWTLGANQCGKAALAAWRDLLRPALETLPLKLWPFEGPLHSLATANHITVAETYPAEALRQLGLKLTASKQNQTARQNLATPLFATLDRLNIHPAQELRHLIETGFGPKPSGEDPFDSLIGALNIINILDHHHPEAPPTPPHPWEGWILGQTDLPIEPG